MIYKHEDIDTHKRYTYKIIMEKQSLDIEASMLEVADGCYNLWITDTIEDGADFMVLRDLVASYGINQVIGVVKYQGGE